MRFPLLHTIYTCFNDWADRFSFCCSKGCSVCCTQNVTITSLEAKNIIHFLHSNNRIKLTVRQLRRVKHTQAPRLTTNEYVQGSIDNHELHQQHTDQSTTCLFLEENVCTIYPVRPFSCRCFTSQKICTAENPASIPDEYLYGAIITQQILEHLDQSRPWGSMTDMLIGQIHAPSATISPPDSSETNSFEEATSRLLVCKPCSQLCIHQHHELSLSALIESIFSTQVGTHTIGQIVNGR